MTTFASSLFVAHGSIGFNLQASVRPHCAPERAPVQRYSAADVAQCFFNAAFHPFQAANEDVRRGGLALQACLDLRPRMLRLPLQCHDIRDRQFAELQLDRLRGCIWPFGPPLTPTFFRAPRKIPLAKSPRI